MRGTTIAVEKVPPTSRVYLATVIDPCLLIKGGRAMTVVGIIYEGETQEQRVNYDTFLLVGKMVIFNLTCLGIYGKVFIHGYI